MALVICPDCDNKVSSVAPACPQCGRPMRAQTIENTAKGLKAQIAIFGLVFWIGLIWGIIAIIAANNDPALDIDRTALITFAMVVVGILGVLTAKIKIWWRHE